MKKEKEMNKICEHIERLEYTIKLKNSIGMFDVNKYCEDYYCELLNLVYGYNLSNINFEDKNSKYIDLSDRDVRVCIQITSRKDANKVYETLKKFNASELVDEYKRFIFFLIAEKWDNIWPSKTKGKIDFDVKRDIKCNEDLYKDIFKLDDEKREKVLEYLSIQGMQNPTLFDYGSLDKEKYTIGKEYIDRKVCLSSVYSSDFLENDNYDTLENIIKLDKRVVLLSDAGYGKSELCKRVANIINLELNGCAFYYRLNNYTDNKIEDLKPENYKSAPNAGVTYILDAFDEIEDKNKNTFIKNLNNFISKNLDVHIVVSSRTNFYKNDDYFTDFKTYTLIPLSETDIRVILSKRNINFYNFIDEVTTKGLNHFLNNPFYLFNIINKYENGNTLPDKKYFVKEIVLDSFIFDERKYMTTIELDEEKNHLYEMLGIISLCMQCIGRNTLTKDEVNKIFPNKLDRKLMNYSRICLNTNGSFSFIHNNFGEFLASEILKGFLLEDIQKLVTYDNAEMEVKDTWMNTISFLLDNSDDDLKEWILEAIPDGICYLEKSYFSDEIRQRIFKDFFDSYENKKIWLPRSVHNNNQFIEFISSKESVDYLLNKISENIHYSIVYNAISILIQFKKLYGNKKKVQELMFDITINKNYISELKRYALMILADNMLITEEYLLAIVDKNRKSEDAYMRTGYFYVLNKIGLSEKTLKIVCDRFNVVNNKSAMFVDENDEEADGDIYFYSEHVQFNNLFLNLNSYYVLECLIVYLEELNTKKASYNLPYEMIRNICLSLKKLHIKDNKAIDIIFRLFNICLISYDDKNIKIILTEIKTQRLNLTFFKKYLALDEKVHKYESYYIVNDDCLMYFIEEYRKDNYDNNLAQEILLYANNKLDNYNCLVSIYFEKTGINYLEKEKSSVNQVESEQDFFNTLFNIDDFISCLNDFKQIIGQEFITGKLVKEIKYCEFRQNKKLYEMLRFLKRLDTDHIITDNYIKSLNWDLIILSESYNYLTKKTKIEISDLQRSLINDICIRQLQYNSFQSSIKYENSGEQFSTSYMIIYLWYFRNMFNFSYPENVLLDMLDFDWAMEDGKSIGIDYITINVSEYKVTDRIINNVKEKTMYNGVLKNHVGYCLNKKIKDLSIYLNKYLLDKSISTYYKDIIVNYLLFDQGAETLIVDYLDKVDFETETLIISRVFEQKNYCLVDILEEKLEKEVDDKRLILYIKYLIKYNKLSGLQKYYELLRKNKKNIDRDYGNNIVSSLSDVNAIDLTDEIIKIYLLTYDVEFKEGKFESVSSSCKNALINIGLSNIEENSHIVTINKIEKLINDNMHINNIGFAYYIIEELMQNYNQISQSTKNIIKIIEELNTIRKKSPSTGIIL